MKMELLAFQKQVLKKWKEIKELIAKIANIPIEIEKEKKMRSKWVTVRDTRLKSQVVDNKPRHLIKKVIR